MNQPLKAFKLNGINSKSTKNLSINTKINGLS